jgi:hypothetical protein
MTLFLLAASGALAAAPVARVGGLGAARSVALLVQKGDEVAAIPCNDAAVAPDVAPDGIWSCGPFPLVTGAVRVGVVRDGRLLDAGTAELGGAPLVLVVSGGAATLGGTLPAPAATAPQAGAPTVVARVTGLGEGSAPVVRLQGSGGGVELMCRDDGVFPDVVRNDAVHGCAGPAPGAGAEVSVNGKDGATRSYGKVSWEAGQALGYLVVDGAAGVARVERFTLNPFPPPEDTSGTAPPPGPEPKPPAPVPPTAPVSPQPGGEQAPTPPEDANRREGEERSPVATREALPSAPLSPAALLVAFALGAGGVLAFQRRGARLPALLQLQPSPPLLPGGPGLADGPVAVCVSDPVAFAATLLPALARHRRVVLVAPAGAAFPPVPDGPVYRSAGFDCQEIEAAVRALARTAGPPVAVLVVGEGLTEPGAVAPDPVRTLRAGLGAGVWFGVVTAGDAPNGFLTWTASGPPWALARATLPA